MKIGAENRPKLTSACALMALALIVIGRSIYEWQSPAPVIAANNGIYSTQIAEIHGKKHPNSLDPTVHFTWLQFSENHEYAGNGRNVFALNSEPDVKEIANSEPKQSSPERTEQSLPQVIPIPLQFFGFATIKGTPRKVCVHDEDSVFIAKEGEIVGSRYKIVNVTSSSVDVEDLIENRRQTLALQHD